MSAWYEQISEEGVKFACVVEGGVRHPLREHFMAASYQEARDWVDAAYIRKTTPKVKKPVEPVYVSELDDMAAALPDDAETLMAGIAERYPVTLAALAEGPNASPAPEAAETATGDQAGSAEARGLSDEDGWVSTGPAGPVSVLGSVPTGTLGQDVPEVLVKRRGRPPKVSA